jgi:stage II sporulation protein D
VSFARAFVVAALILALLPEPARAAQPEGETVTISATGDGYVELNGRRYRGPLVVTAHEDGLAVVETVSIDAYLEGIREVPFGWDRDALAAQVVAARTYLAWTLSDGRTGTGARIGYDICATAACQVYAGVDAILGEGGERWRAAVESTTGEILVHDGAPARAYYSSTTGGRTRNIEDIWPGSDPAPYLVGVPSQGEESPWVEWSWELSAGAMQRLLAEAGLATGRVESITTRTTEDGAGPWMVDIVSEAGTVSLDTWSLRSKLNAAASIMPRLLPATNEDGRVYPTTVLSPQYTIRAVERTWDFFGYSVPVTHYIVEGGGWGHLIGMSQFGAQAMARRGASYREILAHYYGGLVPVAGDGFLPAQVTVGLVVGAESVTVEADTVLEVALDGEEMPVPTPGGWRFENASGRVLVVPPPSRPPWVRPGMSSAPF